MTGPKRPALGRYPTFSSRLTLLRGPGNVSPGPPSTSSAARSHTLRRGDPTLSALVPSRRGRLPDVRLQGPRPLLGSRRKAWPGVPAWCPQPGEGRAPLPCPRARGRITLPRGPAGNCLGLHLSGSREARPGLWLGVRGRSRKAAQRPSRPRPRRSRLTPAWGGAWLVPPSAWRGLERSPGRELLRVSAPFVGIETRGAGKPARPRRTELRTAASGPRGPSGARKLRSEDARDVKGPRRLATPAPGGLKSEIGKAGCGRGRARGWGWETAAERGGGRGLS